ncbi:DUF309 domain-containing protein [Paenactinomyces guangxiensis]|uniref:DUF309 domain-containing protein n=1 Tax=Paenactinomyces guangxiensis TaxID=1490290 RepID=A0A7W2A8Q4_9BACL|nr:DUF309 domain-containing protein [Paenactinomyces guangxiensis]MBA4494870.1 DUF309 domain-containing protein [Paenactinomyces guangxiensis]MBH8591953.1 DUF309 domain-containing protein [Paenactinomyces guangxiensis]
MAEHTYDYPQLYIDFLYYFNVEQDYYECHEVLEELWLEEGRDRFYQGLLQIAVGLYHFQNGNIGGAVKMMKAAHDKLAEYPEPFRMGIDLQQVKRETEHYLKRLERFSEHPFSFYHFKMELADPVLQDLVKQRAD